MSTRIYYKLVVREHIHSTKAKSEYNDQNHIIGKCNSR